MMRRRIFTLSPTLVLGALGLALASLAHGQTAPIDVRWTPERPPPGTLVRITAEVADAASIGRLDGVVAGQPLHFSAVDGALVAFAGIPADASDSVPLRLAVNGPAGRGDSISLMIPLHVEPEPPAAKPAERLAVAPRFGREPDSATSARMARESAMAMEVARRAHDTPRLWDGPFVRPRDSRITSRFGTGRLFNGAVRSRHFGVDLAGAVGAPVRASNRGVVALVADFLLAGTAVYIDHGAGLVTGYFHLSKSEVAVGDTVSRGAVIGRVGATGRVTGPHLHWIARYGTVTVDPLTVVEATDVRSRR
jgi:murein DD-endopeptidase MepM/ murein hydrolase activator NlpD